MKTRDFPILALLNQQVTLVEKECNELNNENIYVETQLEIVNDKEELFQKESFLDQSSEEHVQMETSVNVTRDMDGEAKEDRYSTGS